MKAYFQNKRLKLISLFGLLLLFSCGGGDDDVQTVIPAPVAAVITAADLAATTPENPEAGATLGTVQASVSTGSLQYSLTSQSVAGALAINASTGVVTVADAALFDFETVQSLTANVRVTAGNVIKDITVTITLTDVDEMDASYTIWTGATLTFTKSNGGDPTLASQQDAITDNVKITRGNTGGDL